MSIIEPIIKLILVGGCITAILFLIATPWLNMLYSAFHKRSHLDRVKVTWILWLLAKTTTFSIVDMASTTDKFQIQASVWWSFAKVQFGIYTSVGMAEQEAEHFVNHLRDWLANASQSVRVYKQFKI